MLDVEADVPDVAVAHFTLRWEAEFAQGFLTDAGIPARVVDEGGVGSGAYTGDLHGAAVVVPEARAEDARRTLEAAGVLESEEERLNAPPPLLERDLPPVTRADIQDITEQLQAARRAETRHGIYAIAGITPAALIPLLGLMMEGNGALVALLLVLVVVLEGRKWIQSGREARRLELLLLEMEEALESGDTPGPAAPGSEE